MTVLHAATARFAKHRETFKKLTAKLVSVFREKSVGVSGSSRKQAKHGTTYTLALDNQKKSSSVYSHKSMEVDNHFIDSEGVGKLSVAGSL